jgi:hypothetical protein
VANNTTASPWILDTAGAVTTDKIRVAKIRWDAEGAAAGNNATLTNAAGRAFWAGSATGVNTTIESDTFSGVEGNVEGLSVGVIEAGRLYVYLA